MTNSTAVVKALITFGIVLPLAILLGYFLGNLQTSQDVGESIFAVSNYRDPSVILAGLVLSVLCLPLFLKWHHRLLYLSWNSAAVVFFLPGRPELWMFMSLASFMIVLIQRAIHPESLMKPVHFVMWPLLFILLVVLVTAYLNGGIHLGSLGAESLGGRKYLYIIAAIIGFFAMTSYPISESSYKFYFGTYFLSAVTETFGDLVALAEKVSPAAGSVLIFFLYIFPPKVNTSLLSAGGPSFQSNPVYRDYGLSVACEGVFLYMMARYGIKKILTSGVIKKLILLATIVGCLAGGFRTLLVTVCLVLFFMFWLEGLFRSKFILLPILAVLVLVPLAPFAYRLPSGLQRTLSVVPMINVSQEARLSAEASSEWRIQMWKQLLPQIPQYLWLGKGFEANTLDYVSVASESQSGDTTEAATMVGDYHNGPLSVIIPFGIWGVIGWLWFLLAVFRALYLNYRNGDARLKIFNTSMLAAFLAKTIFFFTVFGAFQNDIAKFVGLVALSITINGGIRRTAPDRSRVAESTSNRFNYPIRFTPSLLR